MTARNLFAYAHQDIEVILILEYMSFILYYYCMKSGLDCGEAIDYCVLDPCRNDGRCSSRDGSYHCQCPPGFHGIFLILQKLLD